MDCVVCALPSSYNRAVVDVVHDRELGVICPECEAEFFGEILTNGEWTETQCVLCSRDGFYALPEYTAYLETVDGKQVSKSEYSLDAPNPHLCDKHFTQIIEEANQESTTQKSRNKS